MNVAEHSVAPEEIMAMLDGELNSDRIEAVEAHLAQCANCQTLASQLRHVSQDLAAWEVAAPPFPLRAPAAALRAPSVRRRWWAWRPLPAFAVAAGAGTVAVLLAVNAWFAAPPPRQIATALGMPRAAVEERGQPPSTAADPDVARHFERTDRRLAAEALERRIQPGAASTPGPVPQAGTLPQPLRVPKIIRTANLAVVVDDFDAVRPSIERVLREVGGFIGHMQATDAAPGQTLRATLRVPSQRLDEAIRSLKTLGRVIDETQSGDDVTDQVQDLEARLSNSRNMEKRLNEVLRTRTGDVSDVLEVEREIARVRGEIERLDADRVNLERRASYATVTLQVSAQRQATLDTGPLPVRSRLRNAFVDGLRQAYESVLTLVLVIAQAGPVLLLWALLLWWPARMVLRIFRAPAG